jgi:hypothetical protein
VGGNIGAKASPQNKKSFKEQNNQKEQKTKSS